MQLTIYGLAIVALLTLIIVAVKKYWPGYVDDNKAEQIVEDVIEVTTGVKADLTPLSPEPTTSVPNTPGTDTQAK